jgi:hypothetical protein
MNGVEERLIRDIEAVTGTVIVSDADLRDARTSLDERIGNRQRSDRRRGVVVAAAAAALVLGFAVWQGLEGSEGSEQPVGPGPSPLPADFSATDRTFLAGEAPTPEFVRGVWRLDNPTGSRMLFQFTEDGEFRYDDAGLLSEDPLVHGTYDIEGYEILVEVDGGLAECEGRTFALYAGVADVGRLNVVPYGLAGDDCQRPVRHQWVLEQQLPTPEGTDLRAPPGASWNPPLGRASIGGTWWISGGGYLVELRTDGSYSVLAGYGEVVDRGTWTDDGSSTRLTMTSSADSPSCGGGDRYVLDDLRTKDLGTAILQGTLARDDCALGLPVGKGWFLLAR